MKPTVTDDITLLVFVQNSKETSASVLEEHLGDSKVVRAGGFRTIFPAQLLLRTEKVGRVWPSARASDLQVFLGESPPPLASQAHIMWTQPLVEPRLPALLSGLKEGTLAESCPHTTNGKRVLL